MSSNRNLDGDLQETSVPPPHAVPSFDEFHFFPKLPIELRLAIWKLALPDERIVEIIFNHRHKKNRQAKFLSRTPTPAILHACSESRVAGLKVYSKLVVNDRFMRTSIRWDRDLIFVDGASWYQFFGKEPMKTFNSEFHRECQRIAISEWGCEWFASDSLLRGQRFLNLEKLIWVQEVGKKRDRTKQLQRLLEPTDQIHPRRFGFDTVVRQLAARKRQIECILKRPEFG